jgi:hypothetical protein
MGLYPSFQPVTPVDIGDRHDKECQRGSNEYSVLHQLPLLVETGATP